jgi:hypothetical protein
MKKVIFALSFVFLLSNFSFGQERDPSLGLESGTSLTAELQSTVDVKKARVGDQVVLKTTKAIKQRGETIIPKGTSLIGRITEVQQKTKQNGASRIGMIFDRIQGKNLSAPINASIVSVTNAQAGGSLGDTLDTGIAGSSSSSGRASTGGSSSGGGGLLGGVTNTVGGVAGTATNTVGGVANTAGQTAGNVTNTAGQTLGNTAGTLGRTINGIQISNSVSGSAQGSTTLSSPGNNIKLEKGVTFQLRFNGN